MQQPSQYIRISPHSRIRPGSILPTLARHLEENPQRPLIDQERDSGALSRLSVPRRNLIAHSLTRLGEGGARIGDLVTEFKPFNNTTKPVGTVRARDFVRDGYSYIGRVCDDYLFRAMGLEDGHKAAITPEFDALFTTRLRNLNFSNFNEAIFDRSANPLNKQRVAEARLRATLHLGCEGAVFGAAIRALSIIIKQLEKEDIELPSLKEAVTAVNNVEQRSISYGMYRLERIARKKYISTLCAVVSELRAIRPIAETVSGETAQLIPDSSIMSFRAAINRDIRVRVRRWLARLALLRWSKLTVLDPAI